MKAKKQEVNQIKSSSYIPRKKFTVLVPDQPKLIESTKKKKVTFSSSKLPSTSAKDPLELFENWPLPDSIESFDFQTSILEEKFVDRFFDDKDLKLLFNYEIPNIYWRRPGEFVVYGLILQEIIKRKNMTISPKFVVDIINAPSSTRKNLTSKLAQTENQDLNNFLTENALTLSRILKNEHNCYIIDSMERTEIQPSADHKNTKKASNFVNIIKEPFIDKQIATQTILPKKKNVNFKVMTTQDETLLTKPPNHFRAIEFLPSNLSNKNWCCNFTIWVSSLLQFIKDMKLRDVNDNTCLWSKIYPQDADGIPFINPSGRYWVKLYFCGRAKKIEIDDRMPCTEFEEFIFPRCTKLEELWPCLITKALVKLYFFKIGKRNYIIDKIGDGSILYSLLGYTTERLEMDTDYSSITKTMTAIFEHDSFANRQKFAMCINTKQTFENLSQKLGKSDSRASYVNDEASQKSAHRPSKQRLTAGSNPSSPIKIRTQLSIKQSLNKLKAKQMEKNIYKHDVETKLLEEDESIESGGNPSCSHFLIKKMNQENKKFQLSILHLNKRSSMFLPNAKSSFHSLKENEFVLGKALASFGYSIFDYFYSYDFNMDRLNSLDFRDINEQSIVPEIPFKQMTKDEKRNYLHDLVALKNRQKEQRLKRIEGLLKTGHIRNFIKIGSEAIGLNELNNYGEFKFNSNQIEIAKVCIKSHCRFPPLWYYESLLDYCDDEHEDQDEENNPLNKANNTSDIEALINNENYSPTLTDRRKIASELSVSAKQGNSNNNCIKLLSEYATNNFADPSQSNSSVHKNLNTEAILNQSKRSNLMNKKASLALTKRTSVITKNTITTTINLNEISDIYNSYMAKARLQVKSIYNLMLLQSGINLSSKSVQKIYQEAAITQQTMLGEWIDFSKFIVMFNKILIIHSFADFPYKFQLDQTISTLKTNRSRAKDKLQQNDILLTQPSQGRSAQKGKQVPDSKAPLKEINDEEDEEDEVFSLDKSQSVFLLRCEGIHGSSSAVLLQFESYSCDLMEVNSLLNISIVSRTDSNFCITHTLKNYYDAFEYRNLKVDEDYFVILDSCFCPYGFFLTLYSYHSICNISYTDYLRDYKNFKSFTKQIDIPSIPKNSYYVLLKFNIIIDESKNHKPRNAQSLKEPKCNNIIINLKDSFSSNNECLNDSVGHFKLKLADNQDYFGADEYKNSEGANEIDEERPDGLDEGLIIRFSLPESSSLVNEYVDIFLTTKLQTSKEVMEKNVEIPMLKLMNYEMFDICESCNICVSIKSPFNIKPQSALFEILGNIKYDIEYSGISEAFAVQDKAYLVKNLTVFKEKIVVNSHISASLQLKFFNSQDQTEIKDFEKELYSSLFIEYTLMCDDSILFRLELKDEEDTLSVWQFKNELTVQDLVLSYPLIIDQQSIPAFQDTTKKKSKINELEKPTKSFFLQCSVYCLDEQMFQEIKKKFNTTFWVIKFFASAPINIYKDVTKFESETREINSWSLTQAERSAKSKSSRINFLKDLKSMATDPSIDKVSSSTVFFDKITAVEYPIISNSLKTLESPKRSSILNYGSNHSSSVMSMNKNSFIRNFVESTSHKNTQKEVSCFIKDYSNHKFHISQTEGQALLNENPSKIALPTIYTPSYMIINSNFNALNNVSSNNYSKSFIMDIKRLSVTPNGNFEEQKSISILNSKAGAILNHKSLIRARNEHEYSTNLVTVDQQYILDCKSKLLSRAISAEQNIEEQNQRFESEKQEKKTKIESFYKSFFKHRLHSQSNNNQFINKRFTISEISSMILNKYNQLMTIIDNFKSYSAEILAYSSTAINPVNPANPKHFIRETSITNQKVVCMNVCSLNELASYFFEFKQCLSTNHFGKDESEKYQLKLVNTTNFVVDCFNNIVKYLITNLNDLELHNNTKKDKDLKEVKDDISSIMGIIERYQIPISRSVWEALNSLI